GFAVLRFDFTGLGASTGEFGDTNFSSNVEDLVSAADFLRREFNAPRILIGHSLGGAAAIVAATKIAEVKGVAVIGAPAEATHVARQFGDKREEIARAGEAQVPLAGRPFTIKKQFLDDIERADVLGAAARLKKSLLILHAPLDRTVGIENAGALFKAAKHPKSFVSLDDADHLLSNPDDAHYAAGVIAAWAARYVGAPAMDLPKAVARVDGGARAETIPGKPLAVALSIDGHPFLIDADPAEGGDGLGPNPTRTLEGSLAACGVMTMRMYATRKGWPLESAAIEVKRAAGADAHATRAFEKTVSVEGALNGEQRARLLEIADRCPVHKILSEGASIRSRLSGTED
ncbi:MAG TPA: alpha/beta fold hydrolase, partial [Parvularculaceae bacterium]|nr:alpha/beta fold hydrolase [Parvularculaceae bacterium]